MGTDQSELPEDAVGRRVSCGEERATVRYVGPIPPTIGLWLGVEWDNPERGKHDGSHEGVSYFTCRHPTGGSFIRPGKASFGVDYLAAVRQVYGMDTEEVLSEDVSSSSSKKIKWFGIKERRYNAHQLQMINVEWLDLSGTLLSCWEDVASITEQLVRLEGLQLRYAFPSGFDSRPLWFTFHHLVFSPAAQILQSALMWPQVEDLSVAENSITELQRPEGVLQSLKSLNLSGNPLEQDSVISISALPRYSSLQCTLRLFGFSVGSQTSMFPALKKLYLDNNNITEWDVVNELDKLPSLVQFWCRGNRLVSSDGNPRTANQMLIAKLGQVVTLNGCEIHHEDRRGAELDYIKMFGEAWLKAGGRSQISSQFTSQHPRYQKLIDKYGAPEEGELKKIEPFALKNQLLKITFVFPEDAGRKPIEKKLPASMLVQKVKGLLYRLLKVPAADLKLTYTSPKMVGTEFEIDSDLKTLQFYSIEDGDQVLVRWS
uniref:Tubulin-specific chaperone E n=1 Tax=Amphiprion ocellaris TaxID=80972 RepID=A0A3Q1CUV2_AMPOC